MHSEDKFTLIMLIAFLGFALLLITAGIAAEAFVETHKVQCETVENVGGSARWG